MRWHHHPISPVGSRVCHGESKRQIVLQVLGKLVLELAAPTTLSARPVAEGVARLHHESFDDPVEDDIVVVSALRQLGEILNRLGHLFEK